MRKINPWWFLCVGSLVSLAVIADDAINNHATPLEANQALSNQIFQQTLQQTQQTDATNRAQQTQTIPQISSTPNQNAGSATAVPGFSNSVPQAAPPTSALTPPPNTVPSTPGQNPWVKPNPWANQPNPWKPTPPSTNPATPAAPANTKSNGQVNIYLPSNTPPSQ